MIAEKLETQVTALETLMKRENNDLKELLPQIVQRIRAEVERLKVLENTALIAVFAAEMQKETVQIVR